MAQRSSMRASDADREQIADRLRRATADGRLLAHELEERMARALRARTYGELDAVVADLPGERIAHGSKGAAGRQGRRMPHALTLAVAIPVVIAAVAMVMALAVFVVSGVFALWMVWVVLGWWFFGRGRHRHRHVHHHLHGHAHRHGGPPFGPRRMHSRAGPWG